jgi:uncharacterized spore protein YtfJ
MSNGLNEVIASSVKSQKQAADLIGKLFVVAQPSAVYSESVTAGEYTLITAAEVSVAMGAGYGVGGGSEPLANADKAQTDGGIGGGGGGGGGGVSNARPVAVISVGPNGVRIEPVVDVTKIALAFITVIGSMFIMLKKMRRASG